MIVVVAIFMFAIAVGVLSGGSVRFLEGVRIHWWALGPIGLALQVAPIHSRSAAWVGVAAASLVASYLVLLALVAVNRRAPGAGLMAAGLALNLAVAAVNGGMPVSRAAIRAVGGGGGSGGTVAVEGGAKHHVMSRGDVLRPLADVLPVPRPIGIVLSVGDVLLYVGIAVFLVSVTRGRFRESLRPPARRLLMYRGKHSPVAYRLPARYRSARPAPPAIARSGSGS